MNPLLGLGLVLAALLLLLFLLHFSKPKWRSSIIFSGSGIGVALGIMGVAQVADQNAQSVAQQRKAVAFAYMDRWEELPTVAAAQMLRKIEGKRGQEIAETLMNDPEGQESILGVMNFFETIGLAAKLGYGDEVALCELFQGHVVLYYSNLEGFVQYYRRTRGRPGTWENFERLFMRWQRTCPTSPGTSVLPLTTLPVVTRMSRSYAPARPVACASARFASTPARCTRNSPEA